MSRRIEDMRPPKDEVAIVAELKKKLGVKLGPMVRKLPFGPVSLQGKPLSQYVIEEREVD